MWHREDLACYLEGQAFGDGYVDRRVDIIGCMQQKIWIFSTDETKKSQHK